MIIDIFVDGNPPTRTAQQKGVSARNGYVHFYEKTEVRAAKDELAWKLAPYAPKIPLTGPVYLFIEWGFELKKQTRKEWKTTRPDLDNLEKGLIDVMTRLMFWADDSQICWKITKKKAVPSGRGYLRLCVEELTDD